ncbi:MAG: MAPEG family protein [Rhodospirillales bacterium]|nr:MAG: MAPEG family protein [Rhodospirillales bacterium]
MSKELYWLTLTAILTGVLWVPYILDRVAVRGLLPAMGNHSPADKPQSTWAKRLMAAHTNAVEGLVVFAPLVLVAQQTGATSATTATACAVVFWTRLAHAVVYTAGVPVARTFIWTAGWLAQAAIALAIFKLI